VGGIAVEVRELIKRYPKAQINAVDGLSFAVVRGEILGLLGPNGAGKSTTIGVLTTRVRPTGGQALIAGVDVMAAPRTYHGVPRQVRRRRAEVLLERFALLERADDKPEWFSGGRTSG